MRAMLFRKLYLLMQSSVFIRVLSFEPTDTSVYLICYYQEHFNPVISRVTTGKKLDLVSSEDSTFFYCFLFWFCVPSTPFTREQLEQ